MRHKERLAGDPANPASCASHADDTSPKKRMPSWTDRILFRRPESDAGAIELLSYCDVPSIRSSDHRAVTASFRILLRLSHHRQISSDATRAGILDVAGRSGGSGRTGGDARPSSVHGGTDDALAQLAASLATDLGDSNTRDRIARPDAAARTERIASASTNNRNADHHPSSRKPRAGGAGGSSKVAPEGISVSRPPTRPCQCSIM